MADGKDCIVEISNVVEEGTCAEAFGKLFVRMLTEHRSLSLSTKLSLMCTTKTVRTGKVNTAIS